jgi:hypothetical protein
MAAPVRQPFSRGEIERLFEGVGTSHATNDRPDVEPGQVGAQSPYVMQVQEMDEYALDFIRVLREMYGSLQRRSFEPLGSFIDHKGE